MLATLPVFFDLHGKRALVTGGSNAAAWKAELLAATGAEVHVFCPEGELSESMQALLDRCVHHDAGWLEAHFGSFAIAVGDCATEEEARLFHERAVAAGIPANVIDKPDFCTFKFGSIVNRSPVVIGISTDGAAPILGQAVRRRVEAVLPQSLAVWAGLAQSLRQHVMAVLEPAGRRSFWERFVDLAFTGGAPDAVAVRSLLADADSFGDQPHMPGRVTFVGAGSDDAELLTLKAVRALQAADVILFDAAVPAEVLELARREAKRVEVAGRSSHQSCAKRMQISASAGKRVVRLSAGDPAEGEIAFLQAEGIAVEIVPGVTIGNATNAEWCALPAPRDHIRTARLVPMRRSVPAGRS